MYFAKEVLIKNLKLPSRTIVIILFSLIFLWTQSRYLANYFLAYTKMTPEVWHSDTPELMTWLSQNRQGRQIVFFDFPYGTLYYSFFDKLYPVKFQADSKWSEPDKLGALNIVGMTGITSSGSDLFDPICAHKDKTTPSSLLVITGSRAGWERGLVKQTRNFRGIHILHEIYDSKTLYDLGMCGK